MVDVGSGEVTKLQHKKKYPMGTFSQNSNKKQAE